MDVTNLPLLIINPAAQAEKNWFDSQIHHVDDEMITNSAGWEELLPLTDYLPGDDTKFHEINKRTNMGELLLMVFNHPKIDFITLLNLWDNKKWHLGKKHFPLYPVLLVCVQAKLIKKENKNNIVKSNSFCEYVFSVTKLGHALMIQNNILEV